MFLFYNYIYLIPKNQFSSHLYHVLLLLQSIFELKEFRSQQLQCSHYIHKMRTRVIMWFSSSLSPLCLIPHTEENLPVGRHSSKKRNHLLLSERSVCKENTNISLILFYNSVNSSIQPNTSDYLSKPMGGGGCSGGTPSNKNLLTNFLYLILRVFCFPWFLFSTFYLLISVNVCELLKHKKYLKDTMAVSFKYQSFLKGATASCCLESNNQKLFSIDKHIINVVKIRDHKYRTLILPNDCISKA